MADDETIVLNIDDMDLGELDDIEEIAGPEASALMMSGRMTAKALIAVAYVVKRRDNPSFTIEDARKIKVTALKQPESPGKAEGNGA
jgi:hypothetical protein